MNGDFLNTVKALAYILLDVPFSPAKPFSLNDSYKFAKQHEMSTVFCAAVLKLSKEGQIKLTSNEVTVVNTILLKNSIENIDRFKKMNKFLKNSFHGKFEYVLLKGYSLSKLYPFFEYRESCDTDVLVSLKDEQNALSVLHDSGFMVRHRACSGNHNECYHKDYGLLELHISLFYETVSKEWFGGFSPNKENYRTEDDFTLLGVDDEFMFLVMHSFKHFVSNVFNLKQFFDILLYIRKYANEIDVEKVSNFLTSVKVENFLSAVFSIAKEYLNFDVSNLYPFKESEFASLLLEDILNGGCYGFEKEKHGDMFEIFHYEKLEANKGKNAVKCITKWRRKGIIRTASFSLANMKNRYPFVKRNVLLLPMAWCRHICFILKTLKKRPNLISDGFKYNPKQADETQKSRLEMIKKMGLI